MSHSYAYNGIVLLPECDVEWLQPLSEEIHFKDDEHNLNYDHEAFLGKDDAKEFEQMTSEDSKERLG